jgi:MIP family channel proteins
VQDRGLAAYIAELLGTFFLVFVVGTVVTLYVATSPDAAQGSDFAVVGLVHAFVLFGLIIAFGAASGGHFNPAVTLAAAALRRIDPLDAVVYVLAQLSGGVLGALLVKGLLLDEGRLANYGAASVSPLLGGDFPGMIVEALGTFLLVLVICAVAFNPRARQEWAPLAIGTTLGFAVMIFGPLTGAALNPARWFGPALIGDQFDGAWLYIVGPLLGALVAAVIYRVVIAGPQYALGAEPPTTDARAAAQVVKDAETRVKEG